MTRWIKKLSSKGHSETMTIECPQGLFSISETVNRNTSYCEFLSVVVYYTSDIANIFSSSLRGHLDKPVLQLIV